MAARTLSPVGPRSPLITSSLEARCATLCGSTVAGPRGVSEATIWGKAVARPLQSLGERPATCARSMPRCWNNRRRRSSTSSVVSVVMAFPTERLPPRGVMTHFWLPAPILVGAVWYASVLLEALGLPPANAKGSPHAPVYHRAQLC